MLANNKNNSLYLHPHSRDEYDSIAQLVEHITFNDGVLGSSPSRVTSLTYNTRFLKALTR
jgi:hypothetical protein